MTNNTKYSSFDKLWEAAEQYQKTNSVKDETKVSLIEELVFKANLYQAIDKTGLTAQELEKAKILAFGEILLTLAHLSLKDNINVFKSLFIALKNRQN